jgi:predicted TIM-barrel fold metal-dependent hydrolase
MSVIIDADTHVSESAHMWDLMDPALRPRRPVVVSVPRDTWYGDRNAFWLIDGNIAPKPAGKGGNILITPAEQYSQAVRTDINQGARELTDNPARLADMDAESVDHQVIYPTLFLVHLTDDPALQIGLCQAYNRWLAQAWAESHRLHWTAILPLLSVEASLAEMRWARDHGAVGLFFRGIEGERTLDDPYFFPIYAEAARLGLPICIHTGAGCPTFSRIFDVERNAVFSYGRTLPVMAFRELVANRIPEQFPGLRIGFIEAGASWVPYVLHALRRGRNLPAGKDGPELFRDYNLYVACEADEDIPYLARFVGEDNLIIGSDYGHRDPSSEPGFVSTMRGREDLSDAFLQKLLGENARNLYGI